MVVNIIVVVAIVLYAAFVIRNLLKKRRDAKKDGKAGGCMFCAAGKSGGCPHCNNS